MEGLKTGAIGVVDLVRDAPEMLGVAVDFWTSQNANASIQQIMEEIPGMSREMASQFLATMNELNDAALAGDSRRVGQIIGKIAGQAEFEVLMGAGTMRATAIGREAVAGARIGNAIEKAEDFIHGPGAAARRAEDAADATIGRILQSHESAVGDGASAMSRFRSIADEEPALVDRYLSSLSEAEVKTLFDNTRIAALEWNVGRAPGGHIDYFPGGSDNYLDGVQKIDNLVGESGLPTKWAAEEANAVVRGGDAPYMTSSDRCRRRICRHSLECTWRTTGR